MEEQSALDDNASSGRTRGQQEEGNLRGCVQTPQACMLGGAVRGERGGTEAESFLHRL